MEPGVGNNLHKLPLRCTVHSKATRANETYEEVCAAGPRENAALRPRRLRNEIGYIDHLI